MRRLPVMIFACLALLSFSMALCESAVPVVRVGEVAYNAAQVQTALDQVIAINEASGVTLTQEQRTEAAENTLESFIIRGLAENRIRELGLNALGKEIEYSLQEQAQQTYEQMWQQIREQYDADDLTDEQISLLLEKAGVSTQSTYQEYALGYEMELLLEYYDADVELSDDGFDAFYQENYVAPYETRYAEDIPRYEDEVLFGDGDSLYIPVGYRRIAQILLPIPEDIQAELEALKTRIEALYEDAQSAYDQVAALGVAGEDIEPARAAYAEAKAALDQIEVDEGRLWAKVLPAVQETVDEIYARLKSGESFEALSELYGEPQEDIPYHPDSKAWPEEYVQAFKTLDAVGGISQPALYADGVHIFCYAEDIPGGAVALNEEQRSMVETAARQSLSTQALTALVTTWREDYEITTDISQLKP